MTIVINEFEVVPEPSTPPVEPGSEGSPQGRALVAQDVERILRHEHERALRVWAH